MGDGMRSLGWEELYEELNGRIEEACGSCLPL